MDPMDWENLFVYFGNEPSTSVVKIITLRDHFYKNATVKEGFSESQIRTCNSLTNENLPR